MITIYHLINKKKYYMNEYYVLILSKFYKIILTKNSYSLNLSSKIYEYYFTNTYLILSYLFYYNNE